MTGFSHDPVDNGLSVYPSTVAITGGTGFIGKAIIRRLLKERVSVRALVRPASVASCFDAPGLTWIQGALDSRENLQELINGASSVIYCAGAVRGASKSDFLPANVSGVESIVKVIRDAPDYRRLLLISSLAARAPELSFYAETKRDGEDILLAEGKDIQWTILRPPAVYGPGDRELLPLLQWIRRGMLFVPGGGNGRFSMIYIADLVESILACLKSEETNRRRFEVHDGKSGGYSWEEVRQTAIDLYRRKVYRLDIPRGIIKLVAGLNLFAAGMIGYRPILTPGKVRELCHDNWVCDNGDFNLATGWRPVVGLAEGLKLTLK
jgi:nucleoside-diphosphate-sugar epimerase